MSRTVTFLFLGGAKRVAMAARLAAAARDRGMQCRIVGYELDRHCPLASVADIVEGLRWSDPAVMDHLASVCSDYRIDIVVPFVDGAVGLCRALIQRYRHLGVWAPIGTAPDARRHDIVDVMFDKVEAAAFFEDCGIDVPRTYRAGAPAGKLIAKPRFGSASKGIIAIDGIKQLYELGSRAESYLIQERIDRRREISVDCYVGIRDGIPYAISPRERLEVSGGEAVRTVTIPSDDIVEQSRKILAATGLRGALTLQYIIDLDTGRTLLMEINPRLGGGVVASLNAGTDIAGLIIDDWQEHTLSAQSPRANILTVRYLQDIAFDLNDK